MSRKISILFLRTKKLITRDLDRKFYKMLALAEIRTAINRLEDAKFMDSCEDDMPARIAVHHSQQVLENAFRLVKKL